MARLLTFACLLTFVHSPNVGAATSARLPNACNGLKLVWNPNTEPDLAGYRLYRRAIVNKSVVSNWKLLKELGKVTSVTCEEGNFLQLGHWELALTAFDTNFLESGKSEPVAYEVFLPLFVRDGVDVSNVGQGIVVQESDEPIVIEAEDYAFASPGATHQWVVLEEMANASHQRVVVAMPNNGTMVPDPNPSTTAALIYSIRVATPGTYYVWVRAGGDGGADNSVHIGVDKIPIETAKAVEGNAKRYTWWSRTRQSGRARVQLSVGEHQLWMWMREDGTEVDQIILTLDSSFIPSP